MTFLWQDDFSNSKDGDVLKADGSAETWKSLSVLKSQKTTASGRRPAALQPEEEADETRSLIWSNIFVKRFIMMAVKPRGDTNTPSSSLRFTGVHITNIRCFKS